MTERTGGLDAAVLEARWQAFGAHWVPAADGIPCVRVMPERSLALLTRVRDEDEMPMRRLFDLTAIDRASAASDSPAPSLDSSDGARDRPRFEVVYALESPAVHERLRVIVPLAANSADEPPAIDSVSGLWPAANWLEREVFDLFGIHFRGHPDLRRLLLEADFEGAPLRKDYPRQPGLPLPQAAPE